MRSVIQAGTTMLLRCKYKYDGFLWKVVCKFNEQFVVWDYNDQTGGFSSGHYFPNFGECLIQYIKMFGKSEILDMAHVQMSAGEGEWDFVSPGGNGFGKMGVIEAEVSVTQLRMIFGDPVYEFDGENNRKEDIEWQGWVEGYRYKIYNYKDGKSYLGPKGLALDELRDWHIGGALSAYVPHLINHTVNEALAKTKEGSK